MCPGMTCDPAVGIWLMTLPAATLGLWLKVIVPIVSWAASKATSASSKLADRIRYLDQGHQFAQKE